MKIEILHKRQVQMEAARWADRTASESFTTVEEDEFHFWFTASDFHQEEFLAQLSVVYLARGLAADVCNNLAMRERDQADKRRRRILQISGLAASLMLALGAVIWFVPRNDETSTSQITAGTVPRDITLPDGSLVHLNVRTDLRWLGGAGDRRVALREGEALFEVVHDPAKPFTVVLDTSEIRVVGTRFNVRRRTSSEVIVTVLDGTVQVLSTVGDAQTWTRTLTANEQLVYTGSHLVHDIYPATGANAALWRAGILQFDDEPLSKVVEDLERYTDRPILIADGRLASLRLGGQLLRVRENTGDAIKLIEKLAPVTVHESGKTFVLEYRTAVPRNVKTECLRPDEKLPCVIR